MADASAPAAPDTRPFYFNEYAVRRSNPDCEGFWDTGTFIACHGSCAYEALVDGLTALLDVTIAEGHFLMLDRQPGRDFGPAQ